MFASESGPTSPVSLYCQKCETFKRHDFHAKTVTDSGQARNLWYLCRGCGSSRLFGNEEISRKEALAS